MASIKIKGDTSGSTTITAPATGSDETIELSTALASKLDLAGGKILQVVTATHSTEVSTTSTSYITTGLTASITPSSASNKILIHATMPMRKTTDNIFSGAVGAVFRGTVAGTNLIDFIATYAPGANVRGVFSVSYLDSPNTTSSQAYTIGIKTASGSTTVASCPGGNAASLVLMEVSA